MKDKMMTKMQAISFILILCVQCTDVVIPSPSWPKEKNALELTVQEAKLLGNPTVMDANQAERAVVKLVATSPNGTKDIGAAIFLGKKAGWVYFMTAFHVVRVGGSGGSLDVFFHGFPGQPQRAQFMIGDEVLDLAVIRLYYPPPEFTDGLLTFETISANDLGELRQGKLGISAYREITSAHVAEYQLGSTTGALVSDVAPGSVAIAAGIQKGDLIVALNGVPITGAMDLVNRIKTMPDNAGAVFEIFRRNTRLQIETRLGAAVDQPASVIYSVGHPASQDWRWQTGFILNSGDPNFLSISTALSEFGISGGPLLDKRARLIGIVLRQGGRRDTALRIEKALERVAQWRIPYRLWLTNEFCATLKQVLSESESDFNAFKIGPGRPGSGAYEQWRWPSKIDLSGQNKSEVIRLEYGKHRFEAIMAEGSYGEEAKSLLREIARAVKKCIPDSYLGSDKYGFKITFKEGFWDTPQPIEIYKFGSSIYLRIPSI